MVEFSILMLVLVPLLLYGFFLGDAAYHQLEVQETVISTTWDVSQRNAQVSSGGPSGHGSVNNSASSSTEGATATGTQAGGAELAVVVSANRLEYSDHTSSFDDPNDLAGNTIEHHNQFATHACFLSSGGNGTDYDNVNATEVSCTLDPVGDLAWMTIVPGLPPAVGGLAHPGYQYGKSDLNKGGTVHCWAKANVYNFIVPEAFMQDHTDVAMTDKTDHTDISTVHSIKGSGVNVFLRDQAGLSFDTWAIENAGSLPDCPSGGDSCIGKTVDPSNEFYRRVNKVYEGFGPSPSINALYVTYNIMMVDMMSWMNDARQNVMYVPAIPYLPGPGFLGSLPSALSSVAGIIEATGLEPSDPLAVYMTALYNPNSTSASDQPKYLGNVVSISDIASGSGYYSQPFHFNPEYGAAYGVRGKYYMGTVSGDLSTSLSAWKN